MRPWNFVLFIAIAMMAISSVAEGQTQNLEGGQGVKWVPGGDEGQAPENAIRVLVGKGWPLCRGMHSEEHGWFWRDIGIVNQGNKCHTLRGNPNIRLQEDFYYLVPAETEGGLDEDGEEMFTIAEAAKILDRAIYDGDVQAGGKPGWLLRFTKSHEYRCKPNDPSNCHWSEK